MNSRTATILVVDDDASVTRAVSRMLRSDGHDVLCASCAAEGLEQLRQFGADVAILDYGLPDFSGLELAARLRVLYPDTVRVLLTGHTSFDIARDAINRGGVYRFVEKPWDETQLRIDVALALEEARRLREVAP